MSGCVQRLDLLPPSHTSRQSPSHLLISVTFFRVSHLSGFTSTRYKYFTHCVRPSHQLAPQPSAQSNNQSIRISQSLGSVLSVDHHLPHPFRLPEDCLLGLRRKHQEAADRLQLPSTGLCLTNSRLAEAHHAGSFTGSLYRRRARLASGCLVGCAVATLGIFSALGSIQDHHIRPGRQCGGVMILSLIVLRLA